MTRKAISTNMQMQSVLEITRKLEKIAKRIGIEKEDIPDLYDHIAEAVDRDTGTFDQVGFVKWLKEKEEKKKQAKPIRTIIA